MTLCEWVIDDKGTSDASKWKECSREATYDVRLVGSESMDNMMLFCWQHVKKYRKQKFLNQTWGKGSKVEIRKLGRKEHLYHAA